MADRSFRWELPFSTTPDGRHRPTVPVVFSYERPTRRLHGLVDSGAERSICSVSVAREAGVEVERFPLVRAQGIGGSLRARRCPMDLAILGRRIGTEVLVVEPEIVILGRHDVFNAFQFAFDERARLLLIEPYP